MIKYGNLSRFTFLLLNDVQFYTTSCRKKKLKTPSLNHVTWSREWW